MPRPSRNRPAGAAVLRLMPRIRTLVPALLLVTTLIACATGAPGATATPVPTGSPTPAVPSPSPSPSATPTDIPLTAARAAALVLDSDPRFAGIGPLLPDLIGQSAWYEVQPEDDGFQVTVIVGWGDCMAGCIDRHQWVHAVGPDGSVELGAEEGEPLPPEFEPIELSGDGGLAVRLVAGPVCPVESVPPDPDCEPRPVENAEVVLRAPDGSEVARAVSDADGAVTFASVPAGVYIVEAESVEGLMAAPEALAAWALPGGTFPLTLAYDTGIR